MTIRYTDENNDYERGIEIEIAGNYAPLTLYVENVEIEAETWEERGNARDYETRWTGADVQVLAGTNTVLIDATITPDDLRVSELVDGAISDALDEIAEEAFLRDCREGNIG